MEAMLAAIEWDHGLIRVLFNKADKRRRRSLVEINGQERLNSAEVHHHSVCPEYGIRPVILQGADEGGPPVAS